MATNADALAPGAEPETPADPNAAAVEHPEGEGGEGEADESAEPIKALARDMGWTDKDQFSGPPEAWKPAEQYIRDGRDIQRQTSTELKSLRQTVENLGKTNAAVMEHEIQRRVDDLANRYQKAVDDGDTAGAYRLANEIGALTKPPEANAPRQPAPEAQDFAQRNAGWFQKDALATSLAIDVCNRLAAQGYDNATQLASAEKEVRRQYPNLFSGQMNGHKPQAGVNAPNGRGPAGAREKGFADMPLAAQKVANDMIERGVIRDTPDNARKLYAKNYWQTAERKA